MSNPMWSENPTENHILSASSWLLFELFLIDVSQVLYSLGVIFSVCSQAVLVDLPGWGYAFNVYTPKMLHPLYERIVLLDSG